MTIIELHNSMAVYWNDPDAGICSRWLTVAKLQELPHGTVVITEPDGSELECYPSELSLRKEGTH